MGRTTQHVTLAPLCLALLILPASWTATASQEQFDCPIGSDTGRHSGIAVAAAPRDDLRFDRTLVPISDRDLGSLDYAASAGSRTTGEWIGGGISYCAQLGPLAGFCFAPFIAASPLAFLAGTLGGAARASDYSRDHAAAVEEISNALAGVDLQKWVEEQTLARLCNAVAVNTGAIDRGLAPVGGDPRAAAACGIHTLVEVRIVRASLSWPSIQEFVLRPAVVAQVRLIATSDGTERFSERYEFKGMFHKFNDARADGARVVREDLERGSRALAGQIVTPRFVRLAREPGWRDPDIARVEPVSGAPFSEARFPSQRGAGAQVAGARQALPPLVVDIALLAGSRAGAETMAGLATIK